MLDPKLLRGDLEGVAEALARRGFQLDIGRVADLETRRKALQVEAQELQNEGNTKSKAIGQTKAAGGDIQPLLDEVATLGDRLKASNDALLAVQDKIRAVALTQITKELTPKKRAVGRRRR